MTPDIDDSAWPVVKVRYGERITYDEIVELGRRLREILDQRGPMVTLADISALRVSEVTALHRKRIAEEADRLAASGAFIAEAVIIRNPVVRALYVGYSWARLGRKYPSQPFSDSTEALRWACEQAARAALPRERPGAPSPRR